MMPDTSGFPFEETQARRSQTSESSASQVAVCVTTRNRSRLLPRLVDALEKQTLDLTSFEVVFADDASTDDTPQVLQTLQRNSALQIRVVRAEARGGPGAGRNRAWRSTSAPLIAFTDDDCVPFPNWLEIHVAAMSDADISQGAALPNPSHRREPMSRVVAVTEENGLYETCNICYRRSLLEHLDGFDETFRRSGEDADLAWRAKELGASTVFRAEALVHHDIESFKWAPALRDTLRWVGVVQLTERHSQLRRRFGEGSTWRAAHRPATVAGFGILLVGTGWIARKRWIVGGGFLAVAPYIWYRLCKEPVAGSRLERLKLIVPLFTIDLAEATVIRATRGSLRLKARLPSR